MIYTVMKHILIILIIPFLNGCITDMHGRTLLGSIGTGVKESFDPTRPRGFSNPDQRRVQALRDNWHVPHQNFFGKRYDHQTLYQQHLASRKPHPNDVRVRRYPNGVKITSWSSWDLGEPDFWQTLEHWDDDLKVFRPYYSRTEYLRKNPPVKGP